MRQEAASLAGKAVMTAYQHIDNFHGRSLFLTWVIGIAKNLIKNTATAWKRQPKVVNLDGGADETDPDLVEYVMRRQKERDDMQLLVWEIEAAVNELLPDEQAIFRLRVADNLSSAAVAKIVGKSDENVRQIHSRICRAIRKRVRSSGWQDFRLAPNERKKIAVIVPQSRGSVKQTVSQGNESVGKANE